MSKQSAYRRRIRTTSPRTGLADIGLMILITFMSITSLTRHDLGINLKLQPWGGEDLVVKPSELPKTIIIDINDRNQLMMDSDRIQLNELKAKCKTRLYDSVNNIKADDIYKYVVVKIRVNRASTYKAYIYVLNEVVAARNELRNETAQAKYQEQFEYLERFRKREIAKQLPILIEDLGYPQSLYSY